MFLEKLKEYYREIITAFLVLAAMAVLVVFDFAEIKFCADETLNNLLCEIVPRVCAGIALTAVAVIMGFKSIVLPSFKNILKDLLWCIPCIFVVIANFPFTAIFSGNATINRTDLIWLFALKCLSIGLMEEMLFRGLFQGVIQEKFQGQKYDKLKTVAITSAVFGCIHLLNLFSGANVGATFLQVGYSFLIGAMLSAVLIKTKNIWLCVILHAVFDFGGFIVTDLGSGKFQDGWFWGFTAFFGVICFAYILYFLLKTPKTDQTTTNND